MSAPLGQLRACREEPPTRNTSEHGGTSLMERQTSPGDHLTSDAKYVPGVNAGSGVRTAGELGRTVPGAART